MTNLIHLAEQARQELPYRFVAYEALVRLQLPVVRRLAGGIVLDADAADTIAQDVMLRVLHGLPNLVDVQRFPAWLHRITVNVCRTHLAREARETRKKIRLRELGAPVVESTASDDDDHFEAMISQLNVDERTIVCLKLLEELEFGDIANITGLGLSAVKMRYYRALEKVKANLAQASDPQAPDRAS